MTSEHAEFLGAFLRAPFATGSIAPSSKALAARMVEGLDLAGARTVVEAGPGTGAFTAAILRACGGGASVLAVELNKDFASRLAERYPGLDVVNDSIERLPALLEASGRSKADVVLSGLPWAVMKPEKQRRLLKGISEGLKDGGTFVTFGYVHCASLPSNRRFHSLLEEDFENPRQSPVVWLNLPPAIVYRCQKRIGELKR